MAILAVRSAAHGRPFFLRSWEEVVFHQFLPTDLLAVTHWVEGIEHQIKEQLAGRGNPTAMNLEKLMELVDPLPLTQHVTGVSPRAAALTVLNCLTTCTHPIHPRQVMMFASQLAGLSVQLPPEQRKEFQSRFLDLATAHAREAVQFCFDNCSLEDLQKMTVTPGS